MGPSKPNKEGGGGDGRGGGSNNYNNAYINFASAASEIASHPTNQGSKPGQREEKGKPMGVAQTCLILLQEVWYLTQPSLASLAGLRTCTNG